MSSFGKRELAGNGAAMPRTESESLVQKWHNRVLALINPDANRTLQSGRKSQVKRKR